jgi:hypothetical protein
MSSMITLAILNRTTQFSYFLLNFAGGIIPGMKLLKVNDTQLGSF